MKVILAQPRGFCAGVRRAIDTVEHALATHGAPVYVRHEIVHNEHVIHTLQAKGARFVENVSDIPEEAITIFSAHGVGKTVERDAEARHLQVIDATCPLVTKIHTQGERYIAAGRRVILIGHADHPEVIGTVDRLGGQVTLVGNEADVDELTTHPDTPMAYITQSTLSMDFARVIIEALHRRFRNIIGPEINNICYATQNRQSAVRELAHLIDVLIVVGSPNSSNANRLCEIGKSMDVASYLIPSGKQFNPDWIRDWESGVIGVTAAASTPEIMVQDVLNAIQRIGPVSISIMEGVTENQEFTVPTLANTKTKKEVVRS